MVYRHNWHVWLASGHDFIGGSPTICTVLDLVFLLLTVNLQVTTEVRTEIMLLSTVGTVINLVFLLLRVNLVHTLQQEWLIAWMLLTAWSWIKLALDYADEVAFVKACWSCMLTLFSSHYSCSQPTEKCILLRWLKLVKTERLRMLTLLSSCHTSNQHDQKDESD